MTDNVHTDVPLPVTEALIAEIAGATPPAGVPDMATFITLLKEGKAVVTKSKLGILRLVLVTTTSHSK